MLRFATPLLTLLGLLAALGAAPAASDAAASVPFAVRGAASARFTPRGAAVGVAPPELAAVSSVGKEPASVAAPTTHRAATPLPERPARGARVHTTADDDPLRAPPCEDVLVSIVFESADRNWSAATLRGPGEQEGSFRRFRSHVGSERLVFVGTNPRSNAPTVWLTHGNGLCQAVIGSAGPKRAQPSALRQGSPEQGAPVRLQLTPRAAPRGSGAPIASVVERIESLSPGEARIERSAVQDVLENPVALLRGVRLDPTPGSGLGVLGVAPGSVLHSVGLRNRDRLLSINGQPLRGIEDAMAVYARLRSADEWRVEIERNGSAQSLVVDVH